MYLVNWKLSVHIKRVCVVCDPGPMVYGICFCPVSKKEELKGLKVAGKLVDFYLSLQVVI